jgi:hypothetical protein
MSEASTSQQFDPIAQVDFIGQFKIKQDIYYFQGKDKKGNMINERPLVSNPTEYKVIKITTTENPDGKYVYINSDGIEQVASGPQGAKGSFMYTPEDLKKMYDDQLIRYSGTLTPEGTIKFNGGKKKSRRRFMKIKGSRKYKSKSKSKSKSK